MTQGAELFAMFRPLRYYIFIFIRMNYGCVVLCC